MDNRLYKQYYELETNHWWFSGMRIIYKSLIQRFKNKNDNLRILDIGCGTGMILVELQKFGTVFGFDNSREALEFCNERGLKNKIFQASGLMIPVKTEIFDLVVSLGVIEHIDDDIKVFGELFRILKPAGQCLIMTSAYQSLWSYHDEIVGHKRRYTVYEFNQKLLNAGFIINKMSYVNIFIFPAVIVIRFMQRLIGFKPKQYDQIYDAFNLPKAINFFLRGMLKLESLLLSFMNLPFGINIVTVVQKPLSVK